jgi:hypothetical protein
LDGSEYRLTMPTPEAVERKTTARYKFAVSGVAIGAAPIQLRVGREALREGLQGE